jgi:hypothetical protein
MFFGFKSKDKNRHKFALLLRTIIALMKITLFNLKYICAECQQLIR